MRLTDEQIAALNVKKEVQKIHMGRNLYLHIEPDGLKKWWFTYLSRGKTRKGIYLGDFPKITVKAAWDKIMEAKRYIQTGRDPNHLGPSVEILAGQRVRDKVIVLTNRVSALEEEIKKIKEWITISDKQNYGRILRAETDWLQEQIDGLKKKKKLSPKKKKVPKKKKKGKSRG